MPSGCAALPAKKKTTDAEGPCMRLAQSYHAFGSSAPAKAEISGLMERSLIINFIRTLPTFIRTCADECGNPIP